MVNGRTWYADSTPAIILAGSGDLHLGAALLAATSPRCGIVDNLRRALRRSSPLPCHTTNLNRALAGAPLRGPKVAAFAAALAGDPDAIPVDIWLCRAFGQPDDPTRAQMRDIQRRVRRGAALRRLSPRDYAAVVWCDIITAWGKTPLHYGIALNRLEASHDLSPPVLHLQAAGPPRGVQPTRRAPRLAQAGLSPREMSRKPRTRGSAILRHPAQLCSICRTEHGPEIQHACE